MNRFCLFAFLITAAIRLEASWYWPFDSKEEKEEPRLSELMEPASLAMENAFDYAAEGKVKEAIAEYRKALKELDKIEEAEPERSTKPEFASLHNKRAIITQAIETLLLNEITENAKPVVVSDTAALEAKLEAEEAAKRGEIVKPPQASAKKPKKPVKAETKPQNEGAAIMGMIARGEYAAADKAIAALLKKQPHSDLALNLKAMSLMSQGKLKAAEDTLDEAIKANPKSYCAYYNLARLTLKRNPNAKSRAKMYYETGRLSCDGPKDEALEKKFQ